MRVAGPFVFGLVRDQMAFLDGVRFGQGLLVPLAGIRFSLCFDLLRFGQVLVKLPLQHDQAAGRRRR